MHEHLLHLLRHSDRLPAITVRLSPSGISLVRGSHYLEVAKTLSRPIPAVLTKDSIPPQEHELTAELQMIPASEYMDVLPVPGDSWHVIGFDRSASQDPEKIKARIEGVLEFSGASLEEFTFDSDLGCAEFCARLPLTDERGMADLVRELLQFPSLVTYQGRRVT